MSSNSLLAKHMSELALASELSPPASPPWLRSPVSSTSQAAPALYSDREPPLLSLISTSVQLPFSDFAPLNFGPPALRSSLSILEQQLSRGGVAGFSNGYERTETASSHVSL